jgi:hypothetical protein
MVKLNSTLTFFNQTHCIYLYVFGAALMVIIAVALFYMSSAQTSVEPMGNRGKKQEEPVASNSCDSCPPCDEEDDGPDRPNRSKNGGRRKKRKPREEEAPVDEDAMLPTDPNYKNLETIRQQRTVQNKTFLGEVSKIYNSLMLSPEISFCEHNKTNGGAMQKQCSALTRDNCGAVACCVWGIDSSEGKSQCMVGGKDGAMYSTDAKGDPVNIDTYYYQNKCYGENCPLQKMKKMQQMKRMKQQQQQ